MLCGKDAGMESENDDECYSKATQYGYCTALYLTKTTIYIFAGIVIGAIVIVAIIILIRKLINIKETKTNTDESKKGELNEITTK